MDGERETIRGLVMALIGALRETGLTQPQTPKEIGNAQRDMDDDDEGDDEQIEEESPQKNCTEARNSTQQLSEPR